MDKVALILLINSIVFYVNYWEITKSNTILFFILFPITVALPFIYSLFCKLYFDDDKSDLKKSIIFLSIIYIISLSSYLVSFIRKYHFLSLLGYLTSFSVLIYTTIIALKGYREDLIQKRRVFRAISIFVNALIGIILIFSFFISDPLKLPSELIIIALVCQTTLIVQLFDIKININLNQSKTQLKPIINENNKQLEIIVEKIEEEMRSGQACFEEGFTISKLSKLINIKEYLVRKAINELLQYSNFNQFLNKYKIDKAKLLIKDSDKSMKEISYQLGYPNPSSFNRAFKNIEGKTPSEYRKNGNIIVNSEIDNH
jgi:AraC-like DNA-binding protein